MLNWLIVSELIFVWLIDEWQLLPLILLLWPMVAFDCATCIDDDLFVSNVFTEFRCWYCFECGSNCVWCGKIVFGLIVVMHEVDAIAVNRLSIVDVVSIKSCFLTGSSVLSKFSIEKIKFNKKITLVFRVFL